ncbi:MAG: hypothetical protein GX335_01725 [Firmicutes bacterium]|nr:hypothetical protein [Bacillota bacterium]
MRRGPGRRGRPKRWIETCLLRLLEEEPINISVIYRNLRSMEKIKLVQFSWTVSERGPDKRIYAITPKGEGYLQLGAFVSAPAVVGVLTFPLILAANLRCLETALPFCLLFWRL